MKTLRTRLAVTAAAAALIAGIPLLAPAAAWAFTCPAHSVCQFYELAPSGCPGNPIQLFASEQEAATFTAILREQGRKLVIEKWTVPGHE